MNPFDHDNFLANCSKCGPVVAPHGQPHIDREEEYVVDLTQCPTCKATLFMGAYYDQWGPSLEHSNIGPWERLWPEPSASLSLSVPNGIREVFEEGQRCLAIHAHAAATTMARRTLEGVVEELGATGKDLYAKIDCLVKKGTLPPELSEWASAIRGLGNMGAHYSKTRVERQDAIDALAFVEALAEYVFTFRQRYSEFQQRTAVAAVDDG